MASIALMGLLTGFAKGASARIEKEREDNEALIQSRLKMAAINKQKRQAEIEARKTALTERYSALTPFLDGSEAEEEKLALLSNDAITKDFVDRRSRGEVVDLKQYLVMNKEKVPQNFTSVQQYIDTLSAAPQPVAPEQMQAALGDTRGFLGARTGVSAGRAEKIAGALGAGSAAELLAYERMEPVSAEPLMDVARINVDLYPAKLKTPKEQAEHIQSKIVQYELTGNTAEADNAKIELGRLEAVLATMTPEEASWTERRNKLQAVVASDRSTPEAKNKALAEIRRGDAVGPPLSPDLLLKTATLAGTAALEKVYGELIGQGITLLTAADGTTSFQVIPGTKAEKQQEDIRKTYEEGVRSVLRLVVDPVTQLPNPAYEAVFKAFAMGFKPKEAPPAPSPPPPAPPRAGVMSRPEAATTPAEAARSAQVAPAAPPKRTMSPQDTQAAAWVKQNPNDPRAAAIRETLERKYGK
jgi:hypothetical protein